jgi:5'-3' exonuclease
MGIPFFARKITSKYDIITGKLPTHTKCRNLYLDLNCAIHQCAQAAIATPGVRLIGVEEETIRNTCAYIAKILDFCQPQSLLYVAIDGLPPRAKMVQQRKRRYVSAWSSSTDTKPKVWDTSAITPGTAFMTKLSLGLGRFLDEQRRVRKLDIQFMDSNSPGEGETKIVDHMRGMEVGQGADVIYGLDADLIMLSMALDHEIFLLREPAAYNRAHASQPFLYFDITKLKHHISTEYDVTPHEYVFLCFLMGNDFLPPLSFMSIRSEGIELILKLYNALKESHDPIVTEQPAGGPPEVNFKTLFALLERIKDIEDDSMRKADEEYYAHAPRHRPAQAESRHQFDIDNFPSIHKYPNHLIRPRDKGWRLNYYHHLFNINDVHDIHTVCLNYVEGLVWTLRYYYGHVPTRTWYYQYAYSPTVLDLCNFMVAQQVTSDALVSGMRERFDRMHAFYDAPLSNATPEELQLLMVLPPTSAATLLPSHLRSVVSELQHLFPDTFRIHTYLKRFMWECHPVLPPLNASLIARCAAKKPRCTVSSMDGGAAV